MSSDEAPPAQPVRSPPSLPVITSAISTPATQEASDDNLPAGGHEPREDTQTDPLIDSPTSDSVTSPLPHRSTCVQRRPAHYNDNVNFTGCLLYFLSM